MPSMVRPTVTLATLALAAILAAHATPSRAAFE